MNELMYSFRESNVRVIEKDGQPWFAATDVCNVLEIKNTTQAIQRLEEDERSMFNIGRQGETNFVNEYGLYTLILGSRKPEAKEFKRWITHEVIPSIRKRGLYATEKTTKQILDDPQFLIEALQQLQQEREERKKAERTVNILTHVNKTYTATEIAKELNMKSAIELNKKLVELNIQFKQNNTWVLYSNHSDKGYTEIKQKALDNGKVVYDRHFTQMGREFLINLFGGN